MKKIFLTLLFTASATFAQYAGPGAMEVIQSEAPPREFWTQLGFTSGNDTYFCSTRQASPATTFTTSTVTNGSPTIITLTGHGFSTDSQPFITISGADGEFIDLNRSFAATVIDTNTISVPVDSTGFGGSFSGTLTIKTTAPRMNAHVWAVRRVRLDAGGNLQSIMWAAGGYTNVCADRATLYYQ